MRALRLDTNTARASKSPCDASARNHACDTERLRLAAGREQSERPRVFVFRIQNGFSTALSHSHAHSRMARPMASSGGGTRAAPRTRAHSYISKF
ncbi:hypothetical protein CKA38_02025 [Ereboglobus luteus]|uniref:Uncharacterized protein n=1 Tax=Ereboglobus luteus TaxID=1796921 RepID=A0A2U8E0H7_9BACT|nr:hypothetical protein CKA38_02025 [Ereboglobus luteus]